MHTPSYPQMEFKVLGLVAINLLTMGFVLLLVDGCIYRDPYVRLTGGYAISAISASSPCQLYLEPIPDALWFAMPPFDGEEIILVNRQDDSTITAGSLAEIVARFPSHAIDLSQITPRVDNVTGYTFNRRFIAGECIKSHFLVDVEAHGLEEWSSRDDWANAITAKGLSPHHLHNPKGWFHQSRHGATMVVYATLWTVAGILPLLKHRSGTLEADAHTR